MPKCHHSERKRLKPCEPETCSFHSVFHLYNLEFREVYLQLKVAGAGNLGIWKTLVQIRGTLKESKQEEEHICSTSERICSQN